MTIHELKIWPIYFGEVLSGKKKFEIRRNDRNFKVGDFLILKEFSPDSNSYSRREIQCKVTYLLDDPNFIKEGFVVMAIELTSANCFSAFFFNKCRKCGNQMDLKGDFRYEDPYWKCPFCGWEKLTIIRG